MNNESAKMILSAYRPNGADAHAPAFAEALGQVRRDPGLAHWFAEERALDEQMRIALQTLRPPASLKNSLLLSAELPRLPAAYSSWHKPVWLAIAASIVLLLGVGYFALRPSARLGTLAGVTSEVAQMYAESSISLGSMTSNDDQIRQWLKDHGAPHDFAVPAKLASQRELGCQVIDIGSLKISLICFQISGQPMAHLLVIDRSLLADAPVIGQTVYMQDDAVSFASWSDTNRTYILASEVGAEDLRKLL